MMRKLIGLGLLALVAPPALAQGVVECPAWVADILNLGNALWFVGAVAVVLGALAIITRLFNMDWLSKDALGIIGCVVAVGLMCDGVLFPPFLTGWVTPVVVHFVGALLLGGSVVTIFEGREIPSAWPLALLTVAYALATVLLADPLFGFFAAFALVFLFAETPLCGIAAVICGFEDDDTGAGVMLFSIIMTAAITLVTWFAVPLGAGALFTLGGLWVYTIIAGGGIVVYSSRWEHTDAPWSFPYLLTQVVAVVLIMLAWYTGAVLDEALLYYVALVLVVAYSLVKFIEWMPRSSFLYGVVACVIGAVILTNIDWLNEQWRSMDAFADSLRQ